MLFRMLCVMCETNTTMLVGDLLQINHFLIIERTTDLALPFERDRKSNKLNSDVTTKQSWHDTKIQVGFEVTRGVSSHYHNRHLK